MLYVGWPKFVLMKQVYDDNIGNNLYDYIIENRLLKSEASTQPHHYAIMFIYVVYVCICRVQIKDYIMLLLNIKIVFIFYMLNGSIMEFTLRINIIKCRFIFT